jgi:hypothetical protein
LVATLINFYYSEDDEIGKQNKRKSEEFAKLAGDAVFPVENI